MHRVGDWYIKNNEKKNKKAGKAGNEDSDNDLVLCLLMLENKDEEAKKKVWLVKNVKMPMEAGMSFTTNGETFHMF